MSIINGSLFGDIVKFHKPEHYASTAVIVIDESDNKWPDETMENWLARKQSQQETLRFCKELGCRTIVVHEYRERHPKHIYDIIEKPDFSCIKKKVGVLNSETKPTLMHFLEEEKITSLVLMGGHYSMCVRESLIGRCSYGVRNSGILNYHITVLSSPSLLAHYKPEMYQLEPKFSASATTFNNQDNEYLCDTKWPLFALHPMMRFYTKIEE
ncbi:hypothetical protein [Endozoicomonas euniceicola]|uniref:Isochorismatase-like domain-containing protein n=1 Tax=Endozoicomonas euniceicola TaxID=1234143 RepID=A0ABY6H203_9GAMM|nr:hypothetical protein [Endozoicomonas euniceicola]UYM18184.1 hypothetical protein NX720_09855 [Endozoicomonas euniceicola]